MHLRSSRIFKQGAVRAMLVAGLAASVPAVAAQSGAKITEPAQMVRAKGARWVTADGKPIVLKGANLGNWLINEFWMMGQGSNGIDDQCKLEAVLDRRFGYPERERLMKLFRDNWMTAKDWDRLASFGI